MIVCVDGGTTNTRLKLIDNGNVLSTVKIKIGAGDRSEGAENPYIRPLHDGFHTLLEQNGLSESDVEAMIYSGMICSENGLYDVPHIKGPADARAVALATKRVSIPEIANVPMYFVPGVRMDGETPSDIDIMRGEETELFGIYDKLGLSDFIAVMPGSHTKIVSVGEGGSIRTFRTAMTGELIRATAEHTILSTALYGVFPKKLDEEYLAEGFRVCSERGINQALFEVRIRQKFAKQTPEQLFSFHCGICLREDIAAIIEAADGAPIYVGGSDPFRSAYIYLLGINGALNVSEIPDTVAESAAAYGAQLLMDIIGENL